jgi:hypothetical protein
MAQVIGLLGRVREVEQDMTPTLECVVHIWSGQLQQYAHLAHYQLSSLYLYPPENCSVTYTACFCPDDEPTVELLAAFAERHHPRIKLTPHPMPKERLCRRAIGRNECARDTTADVVWFCGCDYHYGQGCLDAIVDASLANPNAMIYPESVQIHKTHAIGDMAIKRASEHAWDELLQIDPSEFKPERLRTAIGCLQIVPGEIARSKGYLPDHPKYQQPVKKWARTFEDIYARRAFGLPCVPVQIPNLYRLRHSKQGRFAK